MKNFQNIIPFVLFALLISAGICYAQEQNDNGEITKTEKNELVKPTAAEEGIKETPAEKEVTRSQEAPEKETTSEAVVQKPEEQKAAVQQPVLSETVREETRATKEKETEKTTASSERRAAAQQARKSTSSIKNGLLTMTDEQYKFSRIPGLVREKRPGTDSDDTVVELKDQEVSEKGLSKEDAGTSGGLWGMSRETTDFLIKGSLVLLIVVLFILYRMRSRGQNRTVLGSFPKR